MAGTTYVDYLTSLNMRPREYQVFSRPSKGTKSALNTIKQQLPISQIAKKCWNMKSRKEKWEKFVEENPKDCYGIRSLLMMQKNCLTESLMMKYDLYLSMMRAGINIILRMKIPPSTSVVNFRNLDTEKFLMFLPVSRKQSQYT